MSARDTPESGLRVDRVGVIRETVTGEIPSDPNWQYHSDEYMTFNWAPDPGAERRDGLGTPYATGHDTGNEGHEVTVAYRLQRPLVDANGDPDDFSTDGLIRNADNEIPNTHAMLAREDRVTPNPDDPANTAGARTYTVVKGAYPDPSYEGDPENGEPIPVEITYVAEKVRSYEILQPDTATLLVVSSSDAGDTTQSVTIEGEDETGAFTSETVALDGDTLQSTSTTFQSIDAFELDAETDGNVTVSINTGDGTAPAEGSQLGEIKGALHYAADDDPLEGDLGVPAVGAGSHPTDIGTSFEHFLGDTVTRGGAELAIDLNNITLEVDNGYNQTPRHDSVRYRVTEGNSSPTLTADVIGRSHRHIEEALTAAPADILWQLSKTDVTLANAAPTSAPERGRESDEAAATFGVEFEPEGDNAVQLTNTV